MVVMMMTGLAGKFIYYRYLQRVVVLLLLLLLLGWRSLMLSIRRWRNVQ